MGARVRVSGRMHLIIDDGDSGEAKTLNHVIFIYSSFGA
jgi:hypothetical protein